MSLFHNRREQLRYLSQQQLVVQILAASEGLEVTSRMQLCHNCDVSMKGIRIELDSELAPSTEVDLWATNEDTGDRYYLRGHVCWCNRQDGDTSGFQLGVELEDAYATDYDRWLELMKRISAESDEALF